MASPSTVITFGLGSFGSVNLLPTLGYGVGAAVSYAPVDCWTAPNRKTDYRAKERSTDWEARKRVIDWKGDNR